MQWATWLRIVIVWDWNMLTPIKSPKKSKKNLTASKVPAASWRHPKETLPRRQFATLGFFHPSYRNGWPGATPLLLWGCPWEYEAAPGRRTWKTGNPTQCIRFCAGWLFAGDCRDSWIFWEGMRNGGNGEESGKWWDGMGEMMRSMYFRLSNIFPTNANTTTSSYNSVLVSATICIW